MQKSKNKQIMRYGIVGVGAIGGYYGSKLAHSGQEVHFLSHSDYQFVKERGMQVSITRKVWPWGMRRSKARS